MVWKVVSERLSRFGLQANLYISSAASSFVGSSGSFDVVGSDLGSALARLDGAFLEVDVVGSD